LQINFRALFGATKDACNHANIFVDDGGDKFVHFFAARLAPWIFEGFAFDLGANSAQMRVSARRTLISLTKSAVRLKVSARIRRISAGSISERAETWRLPRFRVQ